MSPPDLWRRLARWSLPRKDRDEVMSELDRLHQLRAETFGRIAADRWYRREALGFVARIPLAGLRDRISSGRRAQDFLRDELWRELRQALRSLVAHPGVTLVSVLALVLGIGANTLIFSVVDHVVLRPLPYPSSERLVAVWPETSMLRGELGVFEERATSVEALAGYHLLEGFNAAFPDGSERLSGNEIAPELLDLLGVQPVLGRGFLPEEDRPGNDAVALISHHFWRSRFGAAESAVGSTLTLDGRPREIVGVLPSGLTFPEPGQDVLVPLVMDPSDAAGYWGAGGYWAVARLRPGVEPSRLQDELHALSLETRELNPLWTPREDFRADARVEPLQASVVGDVESNLLILLGAVALVLLVACANVANLLLARALARAPETAVRAALGASRRQLLRQQLLESLVLVIAGCGVALVFAWQALDLMVAWLPAEIPRTTEIALDLRVLAVSVGVALTAGLLAGIVPAMRASAADPGDALREAGRGPGTGVSRRRLARSMVVVQVAAAVVLITGAGLLTRSLGALGRVEPGFDPGAVTTARLTLTPASHATEAERSRFFADVRAAVARDPAVESASVTSHVPFGIGGGPNMAVFVEGVTTDPNALPVVKRVQATPGHFRTLGIPLRGGREITAEDRADSPLVAVVDETAAARFWPGESPLGKRLRYPWRGAPWLEVVGVVGSVADIDLAAEPVPTIYVPLAQAPPMAAAVVARGAGGRPVSVAAIRTAVEDLDATVPVSAAAPLEQRIGASLARARWSTLLLIAFAGVALALGCIGVYGIVAYSVGERAHEFGVQMALGAEPAAIRRGVLAEGLRLAIPGAILGLPAAVLLGRAVESLLFGVSPADPVTLLAVPAVLAAAALAAAYLPARRATRVDPARALRAEL